MRGHLGFACRRIFDTPSAPRSVTAVATATTGATLSSPGQASVEVSWLPPASDGGSAVTSYVVSLVDGGTVTVSSSPHTFTGLNWYRDMCTTWMASVYAVNAIGSGPTAYATSNPIPYTDVPILSIASKTANYGGPGYTWTLAWTVVCIGNGYLGETDWDGGPAGVTDTQPYTHYELQTRLPGATWSASTSHVQSPPLNSPYVTTASLSATYGDGYSLNTTRQFRVRTARFTGSGVLFGRWSSIVEG